MLPYKSSWGWGRTGCKDQSSKQANCGKGNVGRKTMDAIVDRGGKRLNARSRRGGVVLERAMPPREEKKRFTRLSG